MKSWIPNWTRSEGDVPAEEPPAHHADHSGTSFQNPWPPKSLLASRQVFSQFPLALAKRIEGYHIKTVRTIEPDFGKGSPDEGVLKATWVGHAGFMIQMPKVSTLEPVRILFDPIWSERASPHQSAGPRRRLPPPCSLEDLPDFQYVVTSHNHYDHLDWPTIERIHKLKGTDVMFIAPLGLRSWFESGGIPASQVKELDWHESLELCPSEGHPTVKFICTPAQHGSGRRFFHQRTTLWSSWIVQQDTGDGKKASVYNAGDTGYMSEDGPCPIFAEIGQRYGPFDLAMVPIWRGGSLSFIAAMGLRLVSTELIDGLHASPAHAVLLHRDIRSRHTLGMHFATFAGSEEEAREPVAELIAAKERENVGDWDEEGGFGVIDVGQTAIIKLDRLEE